MDDEWTWERIETWHDKNDSARAAEARLNLDRRVARIASHVEKAFNIDTLTQNDRNALGFAKQELAPRWSDIIKIMGDLEILKPDLYRKLIINLDVFTISLMQAVDKGGVSDSGWRYVEKKIRRQNTKPGRDRLAEKQADRDRLLDEHFGKLVDGGQNGQKLRDAVLKLFAQETLEPGLNKPSLRTVSGWATSHRRTGSWRSKLKSNTQI